MPQSLRDHTITRITGLLVRRFPQFSTPHITLTVTDEYDALAENPLRGYIDNLVEHAARARLVRESTLAM